MTLPESTIRTVREALDQIEERYVELYSFHFNDPEKSVGVELIGEIRALLPNPDAAPDHMLDPDMPAAELRLHMGELNTQELFVARAAMRWANSRRGNRDELIGLASIDTTLCFLKSVILCGEPWTDICDRHFIESRSTLKAHRAARGRNKEGNERWRI